MSIILRLLIADFSVILKLLLKLFNRLNKIQSNVIKTMILVCAFYAIAWMPENIYFLLMSLKLQLTLNDSGYYSVLFIAFLYICASLSDQSY